MSVILDGVDLGDLALEEFARSAVRSRVDYTLGGREIAWDQAVNTRPLDLVGGEEWGWLSRAELRTLQDMAGSAGATFQLQAGGETRTVRFRNEEPPVLRAEPVAPGPLTDDSHFCNIRLRFMEILA
jgi:hypothetical protein